MKHSGFSGKICPTYQQFCIASAFFFAKMFVVLNISITFVMCFIVKHNKIITITTTT